MPTTQTNYAEAEATVTIADGASTSDAIRCHANVPVAISTDANFGGAAMSFEHSFDGETGWQAVQLGDGNAYSVTVAASQFCVLSLTSLYGAFRYIRVKSDANQAGSASIVKVLFTR